MKLILKEYISSLREEGELDALVTNLLREMKMTVLSKPNKGTRQYGVDVLAKGVNPDEPSTSQKCLYIFVIKRGNITRNIWDSGPDAVRQSLNDVLDVYVRNHLTKAQKRMRKRIILCTNGDLEQGVQANWAGFTADQESDSIVFDFWGIEQLIQYASEFLLSESLFPDEQTKLLTKTLAYLDSSDYDLRHFYELIDNILAPEKKLVKRRMLMKTRLLSLCCSILEKWCHEVNNLKHSVLAYERALLKNWDWLRKNELLNDNKLIKEFFKLRTERRKCYIQYVDKIGSHAMVRDALFRYSGHNHEYRMLTFEQIGLLSSFAISEMTEYGFCKSTNYQEGIENSLENSTAICDLVISLIENNVSSNQPLFDEHTIDIGLGLMAMTLTDKSDHAKKWLKGLVITLTDMYHIQKFFPLFYTEHEKLAEIKIQGIECEITSSTLFTLLIDYAALFDMKDEYELLREFKDKFIPELNLQTWFPDESTEDTLYTQQAERSSGAALNSIQIPEKLEERIKMLREEASSYMAEKEMSFMKYGQLDLGVIACRHYRTSLLTYYWRAGLIQNPNGDS